MVRARRWLGLAATAVALGGCGAEKTPRADHASSQGAGGGALAAQVRSGRASLLARVSSRADKKAIMKEMAKQLGVECDYCHDVEDFKAPTPNKAIAEYMFKNYAVGDEKKGGGLLTCGDCHEGKAKFLGDRTDKERVKAIMKTRFVDALQIRGGKPLACETCHGAKKDAPFLPRGPK